MMDRVSSHKFDRCLTMSLTVVLSSIFDSIIALNSFQETDLKSEKKNLVNQNQ